MSVAPTDEELLLALLERSRQPWIDGDVAIACGFFTEEFCHKGGEPQVVEVRFSNTAARRDGEWVFVWARCDATPFDHTGRYEVMR